MESKASSKSRMILPVLLLCTFLEVSTLGYLSTLLVDIAGTFNVSVGTASQISLVISLVGLFLGLVMGSLTIRFSHKALFLVGISCYIAGSIGFFFAPNFASALAVNVVTGISIGTVQILSISLIGDLMPLRKRGRAVGLIFSAAFLAIVFIAPLSGFIAQLAGNWRMFLVAFSIPFSIMCLLLSWFFIPNRKYQLPSTAKSKYSEAYKQIFLNRSAAACLVGSILFAVFNTIPVYGASFYIIGFLTSPATAGIISAIAAVGGIFGAAVGGRLVNRFGRKTLTVIGGLVCGFFAATMTYLPVMWLSIVFWAVSATFAALTMSALSSLALEQVPSFRASMMSTNQTFRAGGTILGIIIGGLVLNLFSNNFQLLMTIFGASGIALAAVIFLFAKDPCKTEVQTPVAE